MASGGRQLGQVGLPAVVGIIAVVAVAFGSLGYALAPRAVTKDDVKGYLEGATDEDVREILSVVPEKLLKERARKIFPAAVEDDLGRDVIIPERPERIVSLAPSITETLFALGLGNRVAGVTEYCDYPPEVPESVEGGELETVGGFATVNVEKVVDLEPDLIISTTGVQRDHLNRLEELGETVVALEGDNIPDVTEDIRLIGRMTGASQRAEAVAENMEDEMAEIVEKVGGLPQGRRPKVFYELGVEPLFTAGRGSFIHEIIELAGGRNIAENSGEYSAFSKEKIIESDPDVFVIGVHGSELSLSTVEGVEKRFAGIGAVEESRIYKLSPTEIDMFTRAGPRLIRALEKMARYLHPELAGGQARSTN